MLLTHPATSGLIENYLKPLGITSLLDVPVWVRGEVVGVICHEHIGPAREWSAEEIDFASSLAAMVSLALEESHRARSESLLRESEEKFKALFALSPLGMARASWDGRFLQVNESFARIIGRQPAEVLTLSYWDVTPREYLPLEESILQTLKVTGRFGPIEKEYLHKNGQRVPIVINGMLLKTRSGADEIWGIAEDITYRKLAEAALRESEEKFRALFEASSQGVMLHDEHQYLEVNPAIIQMLGYDSASELIGLHPSKTSPPIQPNGDDTAALAQKYIQECLTRGHVRFEWVARRKNPAKTFRWKSSSPVSNGAANRSSRPPSTTSRTAKRPRRNCSNPSRAKKNSASSRAISFRWSRTNSARRWASSCPRRRFWTTISTSSNPKTGASSCYPSARTRGAWRT
jgi:PAS domain S-box-containing protein